MSQYLSSYTSLSNWYNTTQYKVNGYIFCLTWLTINLYTLNVRLLTWPVTYSAHSYTYFLWLAGRSVISLGLFVPYKTINYKSYNNNSRIKILIIVHYYYVRTTAFWKPRGPIRQRWWTVWLKIVFCTCITERSIYQKRKNRNSFMYSWNVVFSSLAGQVLRYPYGIYNIYFTRCDYNLAKRVKQNVHRSFVRC